MRKKLGLSEPTFMRLSPEVKKGVEILANKSNQSFSQYVNELLSRHVKAKHKDIEEVEKEVEE